MNEALELGVDQTVQKSFAYLNIKYLWKKQTTTKQNETKKIIKHYSMCLDH